MVSCSGTSIVLVGSPRRCMKGLSPALLQICPLAGLQFGFFHLFTDVADGEVAVVCVRAHVCVVRCGVAAALTRVRPLCSGGCVRRARSHDPRWSVRVCFQVDRVPLGNCKAPPSGIVAARFALLTFAAGSLVHASRRMTGCHTHPSPKVWSVARLHWVAPVSGPYASHRGVAFLVPRPRSSTDEGVPRVRPHVWGVLVGAAELEG